MHQTQKKGRMFFFEKKNRKTFTYLARLFKQTRLNSQKFFGSFFQKRTCLLLF